MARLPKGLGGGAVVFGVTGLLAVGGTWLVWWAQSQAGWLLVLGKVVLGLGLGLGALLFVGAAGAVLERATSEGKVRGLLSVVVLAVAVTGAVLAHRAVVDWAADRDDPLVLALHDVCGARGTGVEAAGSVDGTPPLHAVVMDDGGEQIAWSRRDATWRASSVADTELVACVAVDEVPVETCTYSPPTKPGTTVEITRYRSVASTRLLEASSGRLVGRFTLLNQPRQCREQESGDLERIEEPVTFDQLSARIEKAIARIER